MAKRKRGARWALIWLGQAAAALLLGLLTALSLWLGSAARRALLWGAMPLGGAVCAYIATCLGLNNYLAWLAPPLMEVLGELLVWGVPAQAGPVLLCALLSLVGAAAGEVVKRQGGKRS